MSENETILYRMTDYNGTVLYVGITADIQQRVNQHSEKSWFSKVAAVECTEYPTRDEAVAAETDLIKRLRPRHNRIHNGGRYREPTRLPPILRYEGGPLAAPEPPASPPRSSTKRFDASNSRRRYVRIAEAAEYLGVTDRTVRQMIADGRLTGYRSGKRLVRLDLNEIDAAMKPFGGGA